MYNLRKNEICPACQKGKLKDIREDLAFEYKGNSKEFQNEKIFKCDLCEYEGLTKEADKRIEKELTDFRRYIDRLLSSDQLKRIRENLGRNKKQMAILLSVNEKTVGRYENGRITQSEQIDKLYRIFQNCPYVTTNLSLGISDITPKRQPYNLLKYSPVSSDDGSLPTEKIVAANTTYSFSKDKTEDLGITQGF